MFSPLLCYQLIERLGQLLSAFPAHDPATTLPSEKQISAHRQRLLRRRLLGPALSQARQPQPRNLSRRMEPAHQAVSSARHLRQHQAPTMYLDSRAARSTGRESSVRQDHRFARPSWRRRDRHRFETQLRLPDLVHDVCEQRDEPVHANRAAGSYDESVGSRFEGSGSRERQGSVLGGLHTDSVA